MKTALKIGFSTATQHWKTTLLESKFLIFTFILATLIESALLHELIHLLSWVGLKSSYYGSTSIIYVDLLDFSDNGNSLGHYLSSLNQSYFYELIVLNSFFLGVYYHRAGFPKEEENNDIPGIDNILDVPMENRAHRLGQVMQYVEKENRRYYFKIVLLFLVLQIIGGLIGSFFYMLSNFTGYTYSLLFRFLPYLLLILLYLRWLGLSFDRFWGSKNKWLLIIIFAALVPYAGGYIFKMINATLSILAYAVSDMIGITEFLRFFANVAYLMLLIPFISIFYSQTLIYFKDEQEA